MNKKILVYYSSLKIGGAERSLIRMMNALCEDGNEITLLLKYAGGEAEIELDNRIRVFHLSKAYNFQKNSVVSFLRHISAYYQRVINGVKFRSKRYSFDLLILGSQSISPYLPYKIAHINKCVKSIRNDLSICAGRERGIQNIEKFKHLVDYYLCVSGTTKESFDKVLPTEASKSIVFYNFLNVNEMKTKIATAVNPFNDDNRTHIVTVCRVSDYHKGVFRMIDVCEKLINEGYDISWFVVGDGPDFEKMMELIKEKRMENRFIGVGRLSNPFGYYHNADIVAVLSYYEGLCGVVNEAKISGAAVIATEFSGIHEQLEHGKNGWIVENNENAIYEGVKYLLDNRETLQKIRNYDYPQALVDDKLKIEQLYSLLKWN